MYLPSPTDERARLAACELSLGFSRGSVGDSNASHVILSWLASASISDITFAAPVTRQPTSERAGRRRGNRTLSMRHGKRRLRSP